MRVIGTTTAYRKVRRLLNDVGIKLELFRESYEHPDYTWDGETLRMLDPMSAIDNRRKMARLSSIVHELAHYIVADGCRKYEPEYGLGHSPEPTNKVGELQVGIENACNEESEASLLGIAIEYFIGMDWETTWYSHSWSDQPGVGVWRDSRVIFRLESMGAMKNGLPAVLDGTKGLISQYRRRP